MVPIRQVELDAPLEGFCVAQGTTECLLIFRWRGRVVGRTLLPLSTPEVSAERIHKAIAETLTADALDAWVDELLCHPGERAVDARDASVVICTRERPDDLARALTAVAALDPAPAEIIVVDNAPVTDATRRVVDAAGVARYVREDRRGLDAARNCALREARGPIVAFTDDDALPEPGWLTGLLPNFADSNVAVVTGLTLPLVLETEGQQLFEKHCTFVRGFKRRVFDGQRDNPLAVGPCGAGANMAVRRQRLLELGGFDERLDGGMPTRSGGDHDMFTRVLLAGDRIVYDPAAVSWHRHRRSTEELLDTVYGYGVGVYAMWTGLVLERREFGVLKLAWQWFRHSQFKNLWRRDDPWARTIAWHELKGCLRGPQSWFAARRIVNP